MFAAIQPRTYYQPHFSAEQQTTDNESIFAKIRNGDLTGKNGHHVFKESDDGLSYLILDLQPVNPGHAFGDSQTESRLLF